jgi:hypothetical protein
MAAVTDPVHGHSGHAVERFGGWIWREPHRGDFFRTCSFCGSIHPEDLAAEPTSDVCAVCGVTGWHAHFDKFACHMTPGLECPHEPKCHPFSPAGWYASWADRKYGWPHKFYVEGLKPRDPSLLHCVGSSNARERPGRGGNWVRAEDLTRKQKKIIKDGGMHSSGKFEGWYLLEPRATLHAKFYSVHLADPLISGEVKEKIYQACGLRFTFTSDGRVSWYPAALPPQA